jgi:cytochrome c2
MRSIVLSLLAATFLTTTAAVAADDPVTLGAAAYKTLRCSMCHKIQGSGGKIGPDLSDVGSRRDAAWLKKYLPDPKATIPGAKMPPVKTTLENLDALVAYLTSLKSAK